MSLLAALPLLAGPLPASALYYWHLPFLLVLVSLVYGATRYDPTAQATSKATQGMTNRIPSGR